MGLFMYFRVNEGVCIEDKIGLIDIIVKNIEGPIENRKVDLEIRRSSKLEYLSLSGDKKMFRLTKNTYIGVRNRFEKKDKPKDDKVSIHIRTPYPIGKKYTLNKPKNRRHY